MTDKSIEREIEFTDWWYFQNKKAPTYADAIEWADKTMIEKACEWLLHQEEMIGISFDSDFIERFKKAMEE